MGGRYKFRRLGRGEILDCIMARVSGDFVKVTLRCKSIDET